MSDFSFVILTDTHVDVRDERSNVLWGASAVECC